MVVGYYAAAFKYRQFVFRARARATRAIARQWSSRGFIGRRRASMWHFCKNRNSNRWLIAKRFPSAARRAPSRPRTKYCSNDKICRAFVVVVVVVRPVFTHILRFRTDSKKEKNNSFWIIYRRKIQVTRYGRTTSTGYSWNRFIGETIAERDLL